MQIIKVDKLEDLDHKYDLSPGQLLGLDCETNTVGLWHPDFKIRLLQLGTEETGYVFRMDRPDHKQFVTDFLNDDRNSFAAHTDYDALSSILYLKCDTNLAYRVIDTRMLSTMASPEDRLGLNDLKTVSAKFLGGPWLKNSQAALNKRFQELYTAAFGVKGNQADVREYGWNNIAYDDPIYVQYAGEDAVAVRRLVPLLIRQSGAPMSLIRMECWAAAEAVLMRLRGCLVDMPLRDALYEATKEKCDYHAEEFGQIVQESFLRGRANNKVAHWKPVSPRSGKKVNQFLYEHGADFTGFPLTDAGIEQQKNGGLTLDEEIRGVYASCSKKNRDLFKTLNLDDIGKRAADHMFGFKEEIYNVTKLEEIAEVMDHNQLVHPSFRPLGTVTGRASCSGPNFQNFSKKNTEQREIFIPEPGFVLIGCDFAQIEIKGAAALSQDPVLLEAVKEGNMSMHEITMAAMNLVKALAKIWNFATLYGAGPPALSEQTGIPLEECKAKLRIFWRTYAGLARYRDYVSEATDEVRTISNRRIPVPTNPKTGKLMTHKILNYKIQGAARELCVAAMYRYVNSGASGKLWMVIHDELVAMVPEDDVEANLRALEAAMTFDFMGVHISGTAQMLAGPDGVSRWTTGDAAEEYAKIRQSQVSQQLPEAWHVGTVPGTEPQRQG